MFISLLTKLGYKVSSIHHLFLPLPPLLLPFLSDQITNRVQELLTNTRPVTIHPIPTITDLQNPITHPDPIILPQVLTSLPCAIGLQIPWQPPSLVRNHNAKFVSNSIILLKYIIGDTILTRLIHNLLLLTMLTSPLLIPMVKITTPIGFSTPAPLTT
jgi:hypothetical protein